MICVYIYIYIYIIILLYYYIFPHASVVPRKRRMVQVAPGLIRPHQPPLCSHSYAVRPRSRPLAAISISADETQCRRRSGPTTLCTGSKGSVLQEAVTRLAADMWFHMAHRFALHRRERKKEKQTKTDVGVGFPYIVLGRL